LHRASPAAAGGWPPRLARGAGTWRRQLALPAGASADDGRARCPSPHPRGASAGRSVRTADAVHRRHRRARSSIVL